MTESLELATEFLLRQPEAAARALEETPSAEAALLLTLLTARQVAPVITHMSPGAAARRLSAMEPAKSAAILTELDGRESGAILRICNAETRRAILRKMPIRRVRHFKRSLAYTLDTVGAWIDYDVAALPATQTAGDALELLQRRGNAKDSQVFALRSGRSYAGIVSINALLQANADTPLNDIADRSVRALSDSVDVDDIGNLDDWDHCNLLPVTGPDGSLLGGLSRAGLRRALSTAFPELAHEEPDSLIAHLFVAYLRTGSELIRLLLGNPTPPPPLEDGHEH
tara:strand:+ start:1047 stop:1898 length:852 start_codon:yes stop_codon:yes gene_type:complete